MGLFETAMNYFRRLARPAPDIRPISTSPEEGDTPPSGKRARLRWAMGKAHRRVMSRLKQPPKHGSGR